VLVGNYDVRLSPLSSILGCRRTAML